MIRRLVILWCALMVAVSPGTAQTGAEAETRKCEERIAAAQRDVLAKYETALQELLSNAQKAADLEAALAIRDEIRRAANDGTLTAKQLVATPASLRTLQQQTMERLQDLVSQLVQETLPRLLEMKKTLTVAGRLDEALAVRGEIERLQNTHLPIVPASDTQVTSAETLLTAYAADRTRADKIYKGQRILVRGLVGGYRPDPADARIFHLFLTGGASGGWVQAILGEDLRCREERHPRNGSVLVITPGTGEPVRVQKGQTFELRGTCEGFDETVRLTKCELLR
jgi:tRNA_anti-like